MIRRRDICSVVNDLSSALSYNWFHLILLILANSSVNLLIIKLIKSRL